VQSVRVDQLSKRFDQTTAVADVSLQVQAGEFFTLLGPSGCGKTTLLRLLAGLEEPTGGTIRFADDRMDGVPAHKRNIGMVFQNYAIFPHMSVAENVAYGLRARHCPTAEVGDRVREALDLVEMLQYHDRRPDQLSGGQQQRVALARAMATRPALLLMDEPLSNLDARLRLAMREEVRRLQRRVGITTLYVTHDQEEALAISDRIAVMEAGHLRQVGTPAEVYHRPASRMVAEFVGTCSLVAAGEFTLGLRPEMVRVRAAGADVPPGHVTLTGQVEDETFLGYLVRIRVRLDTGEVLVALSGRPPGTFPIGSTVVAAYSPESAYRFDSRTGERLV